MKKIHRVLMRYYQGKVRAKIEELTVLKTELDQYLLTTSDRSVEWVVLKENVVKGSTNYEVVRYSHEIISLQAYATSKKHAKLVEKSLECRAYEMYLEIKDAVSKNLCGD